MLIPTIVDVIAHIFDQFGDKMRADRLMLAAFNRNAARPVLPAYELIPAKASR